MKNKKKFEWQRREFLWKLTSQSGNEREQKNFEKISKI